MLRGVNTIGSSVSGTQLICMVCSDGGQFPGNGKICPIKNTLHERKPESIASRDRKMCSEISGTIRTYTKVTRVDCSWVAVEIRVKKNLEKFCEKYSQYFFYTIYRVFSF